MCDQVRVDSAHSAMCDQVLVDSHVNELPKTLSPETFVKAKDAIKGLLATEQKAKENDAQDGGRETRRTRQ